MELGLLGVTTGADKPRQNTNFVCTAWRRQGCRHATHQHNRKVGFVCVFALWERLIG